MNPIFNERVVKTEITHRDFNIDKKDNLDELPQVPAVFGIFGIINDTPVHPRYVASTDNLQLAIRKLFENPADEGMKSFMQGNWVQMLCYEPLEELTEAQREEKEQKWIEEYKPAVTPAGEYPRYEYEWPYNDDGSLKSAYMNPPSAHV